MKVLYDNILVKVDSLKENKKGKLVIDSTFEREKHTRIYGTVVATPIELTADRDIRFEEDTCLASKSNYPYLEKKVWYEKDIVMDIKEGDKVYFEYQYLHDNEYDKVKVDGEYCYAIPYSGVICVVRGSEIIPIGGKILVEPMNEEQRGTIKTLPVLSENFGKMKYKSKPLIGDKFNLMEDTIVIFQDMCAFKQTIEGKEYYVMYYWDILGILN